MSAVAAVFDVDGTLVRTNVVDYYLFFVKHRYRAFKKWAIMSSMALRVPYWWTLDQINRTWFNRSFYLNFNGLPVEEGRILAKECFEELIVPHLIPETVERLLEHRKNGDHVILLSGSLDFILSPLADFLKAEATLAPTLLQENGRWRGRLSGPPLIGENKEKALKAYAKAARLDLAQSTAYADSKSDLPLLQAVGHAVVVNPKGTLKRIAQKRGWEILSLSSKRLQKPTDMPLNPSNPKMESLGGAR